MAFSFLQRVNLAEQAQLLKLSGDIPDLFLTGLLVGVDNVRTDVYLSPKFADFARQHLSKLLVKYGNVEDLARDEGVVPGPSAQPRSLFAGGAPPSVMKPGGPPQKPVEPADFKKSLTDLYTSGLNRAKTEGNPSLDLLARVAILKFMRAESLAQFSQILERCRTKLKQYDGPRQANPAKAMEMRERFAKFQINKKVVLRKAGQEIFATMREVEKETLSKLRRSMFGDGSVSQYELLLNRLLFTEDGRDDFVNAEHYVMLGNYERDPDRFQMILELTNAFLRSLGALPNGAMEDDRQLDALLNVPDNALELVAGGAPDESAKGKAQRAILNAWVDALEKENLMDNVLASYEAVPLLAQYSPPINPQQLKNALISRTERKRVETLLEEHGRISPDALNTAVKKMEGIRGGDRAKVAARFLGDFVRYHRDLRRMETVLSAMDSVNVIGNEKLRELSTINNTLYEFQLPEEQKHAEANVTSHIILKADIRDSTTLTKELYSRGLNPASYFSLNFFDPVNKLLPKYNATKVFIEGDALILALFEHEGEQGFGVGRTCMLAKEMIQIVRAYNEESRKSGLPSLELGLGICYQDSAPMYLMDGTHRIMISKALNESDRLSGCNKGVRKFLIPSDESQFNVYNFQTVEDKDTAGMPDEFLVRYNIGGIHINAACFEKLQKEISLKAHEVELPMIWDKETVRLYTGVVPVAPGIFHKIVVREGRIAHVNAEDFSLKCWTDKKYYEVCVNETIYELFESSFAVGA